MVVINKEKKVKLDVANSIQIEDRYLVQPLVKHNVTEKGIIVPETSKQEFVPCVIVKKGPLADAGEIGDYIFIRSSAGVLFGNADEQNYIVVRKSEIITIIPADKAEIIDNLTIEELKHSN